MITKKTTTGKKKSPVKQTENKRRNGQFAPGNKTGNRFQPGVSGNPAGRPKSRTLSEAYRAWLGLPMANDPTRTNADGVAEVIGQNALKGDVVAAREICDRVEGKPRQAIDVSVEEKRRELIENAIASMIAKYNIERDEAVEYLSTLKPEISEWIN